MKRLRPSLPFGRCVLLLVGVCAIGSACAPASSPSRGAAAAARSGDLPTARTALEQQRDRFPQDVETRIALGELYYRIARDALDRKHNEALYLENLELAVNEFLTAAELEPTHEQPHFYLAVMELYRGDAAGAARGLQNVRRLKPTGLADTNLAESYVYLGNLDAARRENLRGLRNKAGIGAVTFNRMLIAWRAGNLREAKRHFETLWREHPDMLSTINMARLPRPPQQFEEFAGYCCGSPACGPYLADACAALELKVEAAQLSSEGVLRELRIEAEEQRRLREIYRTRKELDLEIEGEDTP